MIRSNRMCAVIAWELDTDLFSLVLTLIKCRQARSEACPCS